MRWLLLLLPINAYALDILVNEPKTLTCTAPAEYTDGTAIPDNDLEYALYVNGALSVSNSTCSFDVDTSQVGHYEYTVRAASLQYGTVSAHSNMVFLDVMSPKVPAAPQVQWGQ